MQRNDSDLLDTNENSPELSNLERHFFEHLHCALCGTPLVFQHEILAPDQTIKETAACPKCHVRQRSQLFQQH